MISIKIVTNKFPQKYSWAGALNLGPFIFVRPKHKDNEAKIAHEKVHVRFFWLWSAVLIGAILAVNHFHTLYGIPLWGLCFFACSVRSWVYRFSTKYRVWEEIQAYGTEVKVGNASEARIRNIAIALKSKYGSNERLDVLIRKLKG